MKIKTNIVKLLAVLAILGSLVAIAAVPASAAAGVGINPISGTVGTSVTVTANSFGTSTILTAKFDGVAMTTAPSTVTTDTTGYAQFAVLVPTAAAGTHVLQVTDGVNTVTSYFTVQPKLVISSPASQKGAVGSSVTVVGTGFSGAGVTVDVKIGTIGGLGGKTLKSGVAVDNTGTFTATGTVPAGLTSGPANITATDGAGNANASPAVLTVIPTLVMTPTSGLPGASVTMTGSGWLVSDVVLINFGGNSAGNVTTTGTGAINATFAIPYAASAGVKTVIGTSNSSSSVSATTTFTVVTRLLTITPQSGPAGTQVIITGSNMTPGGNIPAGYLSIGGVPWNTAAITIDSTGSISPTTLRVPAMSGTLVLGANNVVAIDNSTLIAASAFVETASTLTVNPNTAPKGTALTFQGAGWVPGYTVTINFAGTLVTTIPDGSGNIAAGMSVPSAAVVGANAITAGDTYLNSATATFTVPAAALSVVPAMGAAGSVVTVTGTGFAPYTAITIKMGSYTYMQQPLSDVLGAFSASITIPGLAPGAQTVSAADGVNNVIAFFTISPVVVSTSSQLSGISTQLVRVWGYSASLGTWSMYDPADAAGSNLASLTSGSGYWINVNQACTLIYSGYSYALSAGWNLIGWR